MGSEKCCVARPRSVARGPARSTSEVDLALEKCIFALAELLGGAAHVDDALVGESHRDALDDHASGGARF